MKIIHWMILIMVIALMLVLPPRAYYYLFIELCITGALVAFYFFVVSFLNTLF